MLVGILGVSNMLARMLLYRMSVNQVNQPDYFGYKVWSLG